MGRTALVVLIMLMGLGPALADDISFTAGETWVYTHEGPRPWRPPTETVYGDRTREILSSAMVEEKPTWKMREKWGTYDTSPATWTLDEAGHAVSLLMGTNRVAIEPSMPLFVYGMDVGEEMTYEGKMSPTGSTTTFRMTMTFKRVEDATVEVPAGTYEDCIHLKGTTTLIFPTDEQTYEVTAAHDLWFHPSVNGMVKEVYTYDSMTVGDTTIPSFSCVSTLKEYSPGDE